MGLFQRISGVMAGVRALARRMADDTRGNVAIIVGFTLPILLLLTFGGIDLHRLSTVRMNLQDALDAAALAAARSPYADDENLTRVGRAALRANFAGHTNVQVDDSNLTFSLQNGEIVIGTARVQVKTIAAHIFLPPYGSLMDEWMPVAAHSEVNRPTQDLEVALVLDITGSMKGSRLTTLKSASRTLINMVVQDEQDVNRTRMALVPYSMGVNPGDYVDAARGAARQKTNISNAIWSPEPTVSRSISAISKANHGVFTTSSNHGYQTDDYVWISSIKNSGSTSMSNFNSSVANRAYRVVRDDATKLRLQYHNGTSWVNLSTSGFSDYAGSGKFNKCTLSTCEVLVTSNNHGLSTGEPVRIASVGGMTQINNTVNDGSQTQTNLFNTVTRRTDNTFSLNGVYGPNVTAYSSGGYVQCLSYQCQFYKFQNYNNAIRIKEISDCVSERQGASKHTGGSGSGAPLGLTYPSTDNPCITAQITPLTDNRDILHDAIGRENNPLVPGYAAVGSTAGQIGVEWGWYMISPSFGSIFPSASRPAPYSPDDVIKVVIIMTDGEFNTPYCDGVVAGNMTGSGDVAQHIRCPTPINNPFDFSVKTCTAMKAQGVIVYTVGFDISSSKGGAGVDTAAEVMSGCATSSAHVYMPEDGASLEEAFADIGRKISQLRITK